MNRKRVKFILTLIAGLIASVLIVVYAFKDGIPNTSATSTANLVAAATPAGYKTSWVGNTFGANNKWVQIQISGMYVAPNGTIYTNSGWDEAGQEAGIYRNGDVVGKAEDLHGWGRLGGAAIIADQKYIYLAMQQGHVSGRPKEEDYPPEKIDWHCVRRYELSGKPAPFPGGRGRDKSMLIVSEKNEVTGLAISGNELFVSEKEGNKVHVYSKDSLKPLRSFAVKSPGQLTFDKKGTLWITQAKNAGVSGQVVHYSKQGKQLPGTVTNVENPSAIALDNQGRLLIADNGTKQQILIYNVANKPTQVGTFGQKGGIYAGVPGEIKDLKFYGISGVGTDSRGNIYIANDGFNRSGVDLRKFSSTGKLQWQLLGLHFIDNADADPLGDGANVFTKQERFAMDYSKPPGKQWTYKGYTLNAFKYPQDPRLHTAPDATVIRRIQGRPFMFLMDMYGNGLQIYRFNKATDGEVAIPSGLWVGTRGDGKPAFENGDWIKTQPPSGEWIWRDRNGNGKFDSGEYDRSEDHPYIGGWWIDSNGDIWKSLRTQDGKGIRHYPFQGFDTHGNPIYAYSKMEKQTHPSMFTDLRRIEYFPKTDTMYLSGFTKQTPAIHEDYSKLIGSEIARIDNWSKGNRTPKWRIVLPTDKSAPPQVLPPVAMSVAGDYVFVTTAKTWEVFVYDTKTGKLVRTLKPGPEVSGELGWVDIAYGIRAYQRKNGEYLVFVEENFKGKVIMYQMK